MKGLEQIRKETGILLLFDEVQCGMCRSGAFFAWQRFGVEPDAFSLANALGNGMPIGAMVVKEELKDVLGVGTHASTFGGNPVSCAAATAVVELMREEQIARKALETGAFILDALRQMGKRFDTVKNVRGMGMMIGVELDREANTLKQALQKKRVLVLTAGENVLRLMPPLNASMDEVETALLALESALEEIR